MDTNENNFLINKIKNQVKSLKFDKIQNFSYKTQNLKDILPNKAILFS